MIFVALLSGLAGGLFSRSMLAASRRLPGFAGRFRKGSPVLFAVICGLLIATLGWISQGALPTVRVTPKRAWCCSRRRCIGRWPSDTVPPGPEQPGMSEICRSAGV